MELCKFEVGWLDRCFQRCLEEESLQHSFSLVSEGLGRLAQGSYDSKTKQTALFSLLGPAFVFKHFGRDFRRERDRTGFEDFAQNTPAAVMQIKTDLDNLSKVAMEKYFPSGDAQRELSERIEAKVRESLHWAISSEYRGGLSQGSVTSLTLGEEEDDDEIESLIGKSIGAMIEYDAEKQFNLNLMNVAKKTFRDNYLALPQPLRRKLWLSELRQKPNKHESRSDHKVYTESLFSKNAKLGA